MDRSFVSAALAAALAALMAACGGDGMATSRPIDMGQYGGTMGGQWIMGGMMGPSHGGSPWGMMGGNWQGTNGSYGMAFEFTTA